MTSAVPARTNIMLQRLIGSIVMGEFDEEVREYFIELNGDDNVEAHVHGYGMLVRAYVGAATASVDAIDYLRELVKGMMP
jgi:hypothetical protein